MTNKQNDLINDQQNKDNLNQYERKLVSENFKKFMEITNHNFNNDVITNYIGDESRTFHKIDNSKPLLSPSRILKIFIEHKFWKIPSKHLLKPRLMGQLIHKFIELRIMNNTIIKLDRDNLVEYAGKDYELIKEWSNEKIDLFINEVNEAVSNIYNYLNLKKIKVVECEKHIADFNYHGFVDMVGYKYDKDNNRNKLPLIIDLKITSNKEIIPDYLLQLAIYRQIYQKTAQCYILFYNRDTKEPRLEKASWAELDNIFNMIDSLVRTFRG